MGLGWMYSCSIFTTLYFICFASIQTSVEPPNNFQIVDPGHLGWMIMQWHPPTMQHNLSHCEMRYKLQYQNIDEERFKTVLTKRLQHSDGFDLSKVITARIQTLLKGPCTNGSEVWSEWTEAVLKPSLQGTPESQIQSFHCVFYNWEHLTCTWQPGSSIPSGAYYELHYWHDGLPQAIACGDYIQSNEINVGCNFENHKFEDYMDLFVCITGYAGSTSLRPSYFVLEIQNLVKPVPPEQISVMPYLPNWKDSKEMRIEWSPPEGNVPPQCLEYEAHVKEDEAAWLPLLVTTATTFTIYISDYSQSLCARVRGKVNVFCADDGFWSEWSSINCWEEPSPSPEIPIFVIACGVILALLFITAILYWIWKKRFLVKEKQMYPADLQVC